MKTRTPESAVLSACLDLLRLRGVFAWRSNNVGVYDPAIGRCRKFNGLRGVSDILAVLRGGRLLAVECKAPAGKLTEDQRYFLDRVRALGGVAVVVHSVGELIEVLDREDVNSGRERPRSR